MPRVDLVVSSPVSASARARQLEGMFDVPRAEMSTVEWHGEIPYDAEPWNVGLIVGPSGAGKSSIARQLFGDAVDVPLAWGAASVVDDFAAGRSMDEISNVCQAVGFNTIPAWLRPYAVLSNGERFRVELARRLLEQADPIVVDEFTSVVDRQVAQIGAHAVQKYVRKHGRQFVGVSCHYDIVDWLQPDWIFEPHTMTFTRRCLQRRPALDIVVSPVPYAAWHTFAPFHYLTRELNKAARCYALFVGDRMASFAGLLHRPHAKVRDITGVSRLVTLPDWQGLGLAFVLVDALGAAHRAIGRRLHTYPAHPALIHGFDRSPKWAIEGKPAKFASKPGNHSMVTTPRSFGGRPNATFRYVGEPMALADAERLLGKVAA